MWEEEIPGLIGLWEDSCYSSHTSFPEKKMQMATANKSSNEFGEVGAGFIGKVLNKQESRRI